MKDRLFGWSLPPGCTQRMIDEQCAEGPCLICGLDVDDCACPECPECGTYGDPACYQKHGLLPTREQVKAWHVSQVSRAREALLNAEMSHVAFVQCCDEEPEQFSPVDWIFITRDGG